MKSLSLLAAIYSTTGFESWAEKLYGLYIILIELKFGQVSEEAGWCYQLLAKFYVEKGFYDKTLLCLSKSIQIYT